MRSQERHDILIAAKKRISKIKLGEPVTNICAGENNPMRHSYFVKYKINSYKNKHRITHNNHLARITDKKKFWDVDIEVIYPGHLNEEKCAELYKPVWQSEFE